MGASQESVQDQVFARLRCLSSFAGKRQTWGGNQVNIVLQMQTPGKGSVQGASHMRMTATMLFKTRWVADTGHLAISGIPCSNMEIPCRRVREFQGMKAAAMWRPTETLPEHCTE